MLWGGGRWRISRRNQLEFEFVDLNRNGRVAADGTFDDIGDIVIGVGAQLDSTFDVTLARMTYGFSLVRNERMDVTLKAGLHLADLSVSIQFKGAVCEVDPTNMMCDPNSGPPITGSAALLESEEITAPLPHFGGSFGYAFTPTITARFQVIGFALELDTIDGSLVEVDADISWHPWRHFGVGAGVRYFDVNVKSKGSDLNGEVDFSYFGPVIYVASTF